MAHYSFSERLKRQQSRIILVEIFVLLINFVIWNHLRWKSRFPIAQQSYRVSFMIVCVFAIWVFALSINNAWEYSAIESVEVGASRIASAGVLSLLASATTAYFIKEPISRIWLCGIIFGSAGVLMATRVLTYQIFFENPIVNSKLREKYLIIAKPGTVWEDLDIPPRRDDSLQDYELVIAPRKGNWQPWFEKLEEKIKNEKFDGIIIAEGAIVESKRILDLSELYTKGITAIVIKSQALAITSRLRPLPHDGWHRIVEPAVTSNARVLKGAFDFLFALVLLVILSPILLITAILVKVTSKGPIIYSADRVGQNNIHFKFPKFRTMYHGADADRQKILTFSKEDMTTSYKEDPRITKVGKFLRRWSIDELPQLYCVLIGTMSTVGPRPILPEELSQIENESSFRFLAKPGLTGLWQISGRKEVQWDARMAQDMYYIHHWSFFNDFLLIAKTVGAILSGKGAM